MDRNQGYIIKRATLFDNGRGVALGANPNLPDPYVTWMFTDRDGKRLYEWGHYKSDALSAERDFEERVKEYLDMYPVKVKQAEGPGYYLYYSTQRPVDLGTFPKPKGNEPDKIINFDERIPVEGRACLAWGYLTYSKPLTEQEIANYELRPAARNPLPWQLSDENLEIVGKWEDEKGYPEGRRVTVHRQGLEGYELKPGFASYKLEGVLEAVLLDNSRTEHISGEKLPIAQQMKQAQALADQQGHPAPAPDKEHGER